MNAFLSSTGISTNKLKQDFTHFLPDLPENLKALFVTTASNPFMGDKSWLIDEILGFYKLGFKSFGLRDIASSTKEVVKQEFNKADILIFGGGEEFYLLEELRKLFSDKELKSIFKQKIYVGISGGAMILPSILSIEVSHKIYKESLDRKKDVPGLGLIDFYIVPHLYTKFDNFTISRHLVEMAVANINLPVYAIDDNTALIFSNNKIIIAGDKRYIYLN